MNKEEFILALKELSIELTEEKEKQLEQYYEILMEENEKINLTAITEKQQVYLKHFYDSATINHTIDLTQEKTLCDIGSGAGFPGIVLKILFPNLKITLIDSLQKRVTFLNKVIQELNLKEIEAISFRIEEFSRQNINRFDLVVARAVAPLNVLIEYAMPMVKVGKFFLAMKANVEEELLQSQNALKQLESEILKMDSFPLPKNQGQRTLLLIKKQKNCNKKYPRRFAEIKKHPL